MGEAPQPFAEAMLPVGDGHVLHVAQFGRPDGMPVVWLHGGPGTGFTPGHLHWFRPDLQRVVMFDQRASGRSTPDAAGPDVDWASVDLAHHVADIEVVRRHVGVERWAVTGASWGSVLGAAYAQRHPDAVSAVVLSAVSQGTRADIDWLTEEGHRYAPEAWAEFRAFIEPHLRGRRMVEAYRDLVMDPDPAVHEPAAYAWCRWEDAHVNVDDEPVVDGFAWDRYRDPAFRLAFARQVTHCWANDSWLAPGELVRGAAAMGGVPCWFVHGSRDRSSRLSGPEELHEAWPGSRLVVTDDGHGGGGMSEVHRRLMAELAEPAAGVPRRD